MRRISGDVARLPTLPVMPRLHPVPWLVSAALCTLPLATAQAQSSSIMTSATVLPRPLVLVGVSRTAVPGELRVRIDGCGNGALTVDTRSASTTLRTSRVQLSAHDTCGARDVTVQLTAAANTLDFLVSLEQSDTLVSPSFAQIVIPAARAIAGARSTLGY